MRGKWAGRGMLWCLWLDVCARSCWREGGVVSGGLGDRMNGSRSEYGALKNRKEEVMWFGRVAQRKAWLFGDRHNEPDHSHCLLVYSGLIPNCAATVQPLHCGSVFWADPPLSRTVMRNSISRLQATEEAVAADKRALGLMVVEMALSGLSLEGPGTRTEPEAVSQLVYDVMGGDVEALRGYVGQVRRGGEMEYVEVLRECVGQVRRGGCDGVGARKRLHLVVLK